MKLKKLFLLMPAFLCACATTPEQCSPDVDPGFFDKLGCTVSGSYNKRIETKASNIKKMALVEHELSEEIQAMSKDREALLDDYTARLRYADKVEQELNQIKAKVKAQKIQNQLLNNKINALEKAKNEVQNLDTQSSEIEINAKLDMLEKSQQDLAQAFLEADI